MLPSPLSPRPNPLLAGVAEARACRDVRFGIRAVGVGSRGGARRIAGRNDAALMVGVEPVFVGSGRAVVLDERLVDRALLGNPKAFRFSLREKAATSNFPCKISPKTLKGALPQQTYASNQILKQYV